MGIEPVCGFWDFALASATQDCATSRKYGDVTTAVLLVPKTDGKRYWEVSVWRSGGKRYLHETRNVSTKQYSSSVLAEPTNLCKGRGDISCSSRKPGHRFGPFGPLDCKYWSLNAMMTLHTLFIDWSAQPQRYSCIVETVST